MEIDQGTVRALSFFPKWSGSFGLRQSSPAGFAAGLFFPFTSAVHRTNGRKWGLAGELGSRMDGTTAASLVVMKSASGPH